MLKTILNTTTKRVILALTLICAIASCNKDDSEQMGISPSEIEGDSWASFRTIYITANNTSWAMTVPDSATWLKVDPMSGSSDSSYDVTLEFAANPDTAQRSTVIAAYSQSDPDVLDSIYIYQAGQELEMLFNPIDSIFSVDGATYTIDIESNLTWAVDSCSNWMSVVEVPLSDTSCDSLNWVKRRIDITVEANSELNFRNGVIVFKNTNPNSSEWTWTRYITQLGNGTLETDTEMLKAAYSALDGENWTNKWDTSSSVDTWYGVTTGECHGQTRVTGLELDGNYLSGDLPEELGHVSYLEKLTLSCNSISGEIPTSIYELANLMFLSLNENQLSGELHDDIGYLTAMVRMHLNNNELTGSIPNAINKMSRAEVLTFNDNLFTGEFPTGMEDLEFLQYFFVQNNYLTGARPSEYEDNYYWLQWIFAPQL